MPIAPTPGTILAGRFRVLRTLGVGGMGSVVEAEHLELGQRVAVKLLSAQSQQSPEAVTRFFREARVASQLFSELVAKVYDVGRTERGEPFIVMELLAGEDFDTVIRRRAPMPIGEAVSLLLHALAGVAAAHAAGLVHRDLKPANLFLSSKRDGSTRVVVLDFGITKAPASVEALTVTSSVFGTPQYMSPEQVMSAKHVDARCDQHAMAMVLYEMLCGEPPYVADSPTALAVLIATEPPASLCARRPQVPAALDATVRRALAKRPEDRFADVAALAHALAPFGARDAAAAAQAVRMALSGAHLPLQPAAAVRPGAPPGVALAAAPSVQAPRQPAMAVEVPGPARAAMPSRQPDVVAVPAPPLAAAPAPAVARAAEPAALRAGYPSPLGAQGTATAAPTSAGMPRKHSSAAAWLAAAAASATLVAAVSFVAWRARAVQLRDGAENGSANAQAQAQVAPTPETPAAPSSDATRPADATPAATTEALDAPVVPAAAPAGASAATATPSSPSASTAPAGASAGPRASTSAKPKRPPTPPAEFLPEY